MVLSHLVFTPDKVLSHLVFTRAIVLSHLVFKPAIVLRHLVFTPAKVLGHLEFTPAMVLGNLVFTPAKVLCHLEFTPADVLSHMVFTPAKVLTHVVWTRLTSSFQLVHEASSVKKESSPQTTHQDMWQLLGLELISAANHSCSSNISCPIPSKGENRSPFLIQMRPQCMLWSGG